MRELKEIFGTVSDMKSGKEIEKGYQNLVSTYQAFYKKAKQMQEEAEKSLLLERILNFTKTFLVPQPITREELRQEYWKLVETKCEKELEAVKGSITAFLNVLDRLTVKYPDEAGTIGNIKESVEKELKRMADVLIKECEKWSANA
ncbi:MAG: hypothetical protein ACLUPZ_13375 [Lachnospiraceae bacterium]